MEVCKSVVAQDLKVVDDVTRKMSRSLPKPGSLHSDLKPAPMAFVLPSLVSRRFLTSAANGKNANVRQLFSHPITLKPFSTSGSRFASTSRTFQSPIWRALQEARQKRPSLSFVTKGIAVAGVGIGLSTLLKDPIHCDG